MNPEPLSAIQAVAEASLLWRGAQAIGRAWSAAWDCSWVGRRITGALMRLRGTTPARRVRIGGLVVAWACAWHLVALLLLPRYVTSGLPRAWFVIAGLMALLVAASAEGFVVAWETSALRRAFRQFL